MTDRLQIRTLHPFGFRSGQWADLLTTAPAPEVRGEMNRSCYVVRFEDGAEDFWVVGDPAGEYEFRDSRPFPGEDAQPPEGTAT